MGINFWQAIRTLGFHGLPKIDFWQANRAWRFHRKTRTPLEPEACAYFDALSNRVEQAINAGAKQDFDTLRKVLDLKELSPGETPELKKMQIADKGYTARSTNFFHQEIGEIRRPGGKRVRSSATEAWQKAGNLAGVSRGHARVLAKANPVDGAYLWSSGDWLDRIARLVNQRERGANVAPNNATRAKDAG